MSDVAHGLRVEDIARLHRGGKRQVLIDQEQNGIALRLGHLDPGRGGLGQAP